MNRMKQAFNKLKNWIKPQKVHSFPDEFFEAPKRNIKRPMNTKARGFWKKVAKRRAANKVAYKSKRAQRIAS